MPYTSERQWQVDWPISASKAEIAVAAIRFRGLDFPGGLKRGPVTVVFLDLLEHLAQFEAPVSGTCWTWAQPRPNRNNSSQPSRHGAGIALDYNSQKHPNGVKGTWSKAKRDAIIHLLQTRYRNLIRWGELYSRTTDGMHFEINGTPAEIAALAKELTASTRKPQRTLPPGKPPRWWTRVTPVGGRSQEVASALTVLKDPRFKPQVTLSPTIAGLFRNVQRVYGLPQTGALTGDTARAIADWHR